MASRDALAHDRAATWGPGRTLALWSAAYLYGSLPLVYWLGRRGGADLKLVGSGNVGATNLLEHGGRRGAVWAWAVTGWVFDASKGALPPVLARALGAPSEVARAAGVLGVAGQCWPAFLRFSGGRGISAFVGAAAVMDPAAWAGSLLPMIAGSAWRAAGRAAGVGGTRQSRSKSVPLGCFIAAVAFPVLCAMRGAGKRRSLAAPLALSAVVLARRLTAPLSDDPTDGPSVRPRALLYRLLYDRNTAT